MNQLRKQLFILQLIDRKKIDALIKEWEMDFAVKSFTTWEFVCALVAAVLFRIETYGEIERTLGIPHSTFGDAMTDRSFGFFEALCDLVLKEIRCCTRDRKVRRALREIIAIDSSEVRVHGSLFSTPSWKQKVGDAHKASAKLHVMWNVDGQWIDDYLVTGSRRHDAPIARQFELTANKIYVADRAYCDFRFWLLVKKAGSHFVTRLKENVIKTLTKGLRAEEKRKDGVLYDGIYKPHPQSLVSAGIPADDRDEMKFRYVVYRDAETKKVFYFVTSDWNLAAQTIANIYKKRWAVELLFRWLKGHLDIRYLEPKSTNAIRIQLSVTVLVQLLLQLKKIIEKLNGTLWDLLRDIRTSLQKEILSCIEFPDGCRWKPATARQSTA